MRGKGSHQNKQVGIYSQPSPFFQFFILMAPLRANVVIYIEGPILPLNVLQTSQLITKSLVVLENKDIIELNDVCYERC